MSVTGSKDFGSSSGVKSKFDSKINREAAIRIFDSENKKKENGFAKIVEQEEDFSEDSKSSYSSIEVQPSKKRKSPPRRRS